MRDLIFLKVTQPTNMLMLCRDLYGLVNHITQIKLSLQLKMEKLRKEIKIFSYYGEHISSCQQKEVPKLEKFKMC